MLPALALWAACGPDEQPAEELVTVSRIVDGDTVELEDGSIVRYLGIDTPEIAHSASETSSCFGEQARDFNSHLVLGAEVRLEYDEEREDYYGRVLAYLWLDDEMVNQTLVLRGFACLCTVSPNNKYTDEFEALLNEAQAESAGLWGACSGCEGECQD